MTTQTKKQTSLPTNSQAAKQLQASPQGRSARTCNETTRAAHRGAPSQRGTPQRKKGKARIPSRPPSLPLSARYLWRAATGLGAAPLPVAARRSLRAAGAGAPPLLLLPARHDPALAPRAAATVGAPCPGPARPCRFRRAARPFRGAAARPAA